MPPFGLTQVLSCWLLLAGNPEARETEAPPPEDVRAAVVRSLVLLEKGTAGYLEQRDCFSCHHQAVPVLALTLARDRGFAVDAENVQAQLELTAVDLDSAIESYRKGNGQGGGATRAGYALWTLALGGWTPDETTRAVSEFLLNRDDGQGKWRTSSNRPPSEASPITTTTVALLGLQAYASDERKGQLDDRVGRARPWLEQTRPEDNEQRVFRLWGLKLAGSPRETVAEAVAGLLERQRDDGGWSQLDDGTSDAYATGTALVVLRMAGDLDVGSPAYRKGLRFLLASQHDDGSWLVVSRSKPFQPYFESGFPHGKDQFLSMAASGWATSALLLSLPVMPPADNP